MSNYAAWDAGDLVRRWLEWRRRLGAAMTRQQRLSLVGELAVIEAELHTRWFGYAPNPETGETLAAADPIRYSGSGPVIPMEGNEDA